ncbi:trichothecene 3-O-acetyltransferase [Alternaria panax]|uniref:Trichothecene 3-O-acetyltransferase n=1 Tax=Alternaria panax TaxID=48097 RepID=A0AAD4IF52_9PLEO|nr:trichothecene 3-O-acetyltransferase [Alternaria panax]
MSALTTKELELSHLDQQPHIRVYGRYYIIFPFPDISCAYAAKEALHNGFKEVLRRFPYLAGTVDIPDPSTGLLRVRYPDPIDLEAEARRIFTASYDDAHRDYDTLAEDAFASGKLPATIFCPNELKHHTGLGNDPYAEKMTSLQKGPVPVFASQATFIPGGLVLSAWFYHAVLDGTGNTRIQKIWSNAVRALRPQMSKISVKVPKFYRAPSYRDQLQPLQAVIKEWNDISDPSSARSALATLVQEADVATEFTDGSVNLTKRYELRGGPDEGPNKVVTRMFRFSSPVLNKFRIELSTRIGDKISLFTALSAIIWANIVHARSASLTASSNKQSTLAVVVDLRKYLPPPFSSPDYLGNLVLSAMPTLSLENGITDCIVSLREQSRPRAPDSLFPPMNFPVYQQRFCLEDLAIKIADALHAVNATWAITQIKSVLTNPTEAQQSLLKFPKGPDLYITSWQRMGADNEWYIPGTSMPNATAIRRAAWVSEGGIVVLPREEDKEGHEGEPYEIMLSLTNADMERFEHGLQSAGWLVDSPADKITHILNQVTLEGRQESETKPHDGQARASL